MKLLYTIFLILSVTTLIKAENPLIVSANISLPRDTNIKTQLLNDLNGFLSQKDSSNSSNTFVLKENLLETSVQLDEMKEAEKNLKLKDDNFYKGYLTNTIRLNDSTFKIQFAYMGINENTPTLRSSFSIIAHKKNDHFYFSSPLRNNTSIWKNKMFGNTKVWFKDHLNTKRANEYFSLIDKFDKKLNAKSLPTEFYCCDNLNEVLQLIGVDYKLDYNGRAHSTLTSKENNVNLIMNGTLTSDFTQFDPHDLWHSRLHNVLSVSIINKPVDEGTAYLYGGSWGLTWKQILDKFKIFANAHPEADWIALYNESKNFDETAKYPLNVDMVINALIVQKIEKEKGFASVIELLSCGKQEKGNENYFAALEKVAGINKTNFNKSVRDLIKMN